MSTESVDNSFTENGEGDLPSLMEKLTLAKTIAEITELLKLFNKKELFKKLSSSSNLGQTFFAKLHEKVSSLTFYESTFDEENEHLIGEFDALGSLLEFFEHLIEISRGFATCDRTFNLIEVAFQLIETSFSLYRDLGVRVSIESQLKRILDSNFERTVSLTKVSVSLLDHLIKADVSTADDRIVDAIANVCTTLGQICLVFEAITSKPAVSIWKCYTSVLLKFSDRIGGRVNIVDTCEEICRKITFLLGNSHSEVDSVRCLQLCSFFCKILKAVCDKFRSHLRDAFPSLFQLILTLYGYSVARLEVPDTVTAEVDVYVTSVIEPLTLHLMREKEFLLLVKDVDRFDLDDRNQVQLCLLLLLILENLTSLDDESLDSVMEFEKGESILDSFFKAFSNCFVPLALPVYLKGTSTIQEKPQSFYEYVCTRFCAAVTLFPSNYFHKLELILLQSLVSKELWRRLLAVDVWSYLGRLESSEMCYDHFTVVARIVDSMDQTPNCESWCIVLLLRRLFGFLSTEHKVVFANKFSVDQHRTLWMSLSDSDIDDAVWDALGGRQQLFRQNVDGLEKCLTETSAPVLTLQNMYFHLAFVTKFCSDSKVSRSSKSMVLDLTLRLWTALPCDVHSSIVELVVSKLISLFGQLVPLLRNANLLEIFPKMLKLYRTGGHAIRFTILGFIKSLKRIKVATTSEQTEVLKHLSELLTTSLKEENVIVFHHALDSFSEFSHETPNIDVISDCFLREPILKKIVVNFLNQIPIDAPGSADYEDLVKNRLKEQKEIGSGSNLSKLDKDTRGEESNEFYRTVLEEVNERLDRLVNMLEVKEMTVPPFFGSEIDRILTKLVKAKNLVD